MPNPDYVAGCVAIAMAQIMKFHRHPARYNWLNMHNFGATLCTQLLIRDIGFAVRMIWGVRESKATLPNTVTGFRSFGYHVTQNSHNLTQVRDEISRNERPVFMAGTDRLDATRGHTWVCDGVRWPIVNTVYYFVEYQDHNFRFCTRGFTSAASPARISSPFAFSFFHMNWGWREGRHNGWFVENNVAVPGANYMNGRQNLFVRPQ